MIVNRQSIRSPQSRIDALCCRHLSQYSLAVFRAQDGSDRRQGTATQNDKQRRCIDSQRFTGDTIPQHARKSLSEFQSPDIEHAIGGTCRHQSKGRP